MFATRRWTFALGVIAMVAGVPAGAQEKSLKDTVRPMDIVITVAPAAGVEMVARMSAQIMMDLRRHTGVLDPRRAGGGVIATEALLKPLPDGHTPLQTTGKRVPIDASKEFAPVVGSKAQPCVRVANPAIGATGIKELVELSAANPLAHAGSAGIGGSVHPGMERLGRPSGMRLPPHVA